MNTKVNMMKSNKMELSFLELKKNGPSLDYSEEELDIIEKGIFGDVQRVKMDFYFDEKKLN